jgi:hypothetical protein
MEKYIFEHPQLCELLEKFEEVILITGPDSLSDPDI